MARRSEGWQLYRDKRTKYYIVRFSAGGRRYTKSTKERDLAEAQKKAAQIYATTLHRPDSQRRRSGTPLDELMAAWLESISSQVRHPTLVAYEMYCRAHFLDFFGSVHAITETRVQDYVAIQLRRIRAETVRKHLVSLRSFNKWAAARGHMPRILIENPPRRAEGVYYNEGKNKQRRIDMTPEMVEKILAALPVRSRCGHPAKAFFTVLWETTLRIGAVYGLEAPLHYRRGDGYLTITEDIDKSRFARVLPLSERARAALDSVCPDAGVLFERFEYRRTLRSAAIKAGMDPHDAASLSAHDFRHASITDLVSQPQASLAATARIAGHKSIATTARYVHPTAEQARKLVAQRQAAGAILVTDSGYGARDESATIHNPLDFLVGHERLERSANGLRVRQAKRKGPKTRPICKLRHHNVPNSGYINLDTGDRHQLKIVRDEGES